MFGNLRIHLLVAMVVVLLGTLPGVAWAETVLVDDELLSGEVSGEQNGGMLLSEQGWQASGSTSYIKYTLPQPILCSGYMEIEVTNFQPSNQVLPPESLVARILVAYGEGASSPAEAEINGSGFVGIEALSWADDQGGMSLRIGASAQGWCGLRETYAPYIAWNTSAIYKFRIEWNAENVSLTVWRYTGNDWDMQYTINQTMFRCAYPVDTVFLGRDGADAGQAGPIYRRIKVVDTESCGVGPCICTGEQGSCSCSPGDWTDGDEDSDIESDFDVDIDFITESYNQAPDDDAYVQQRYPTTNYGSAQFMSVSGGNYPKIAYIKFTVPDNGLEVLGAKLHLYNMMDTPGDGGTVYTCDNSWDEDTITFYSRPQQSSDPVVQIGQLGARSWAEADVSSIVQAPGTYSFVIASDSGQGVAYASKENSTLDIRPYMEVIIKPPPGTGDDAQIVSHTLPEQMIAGAYTQASVTVKNTGLTHWSVFDYQLGAPDGQDPFASPLQYIQQQDGVPPDGEYTFSFTMHAPESPSTYRTCWQMYHRDVHYFGQKICQEVEVLEAQGSEDFLKRYPSNPRQFVFKQQPFFPRMISADSLFALDETQIANFIQDIKQQGFNGVRAKLIWIKPSTGPYSSAYGNAWPFSGDPQNPNLADLNETYFDKVANTISLLNDNDMIAELTLFSCGLDYTSGLTAEMKSYIDYTVVKLRNYPNLFYEIADEYNNPCFAGGLSDSFLNQVVSRIRNNDPDHLVAVSGRNSFSAVYAQSSWNQILLFHFPDDQNWWQTPNDVFPNYDVSVLKPKIFDRGPVSATSDEISSLYQPNSIPAYSDAQLFARALWVSTLSGGSYTFTNHKAILASTGTMPGSTAFLIQQQLFAMYLPENPIVNASVSRIQDAGDAQTFEALFTSAYFAYIVRGTNSAQLTLNYPSDFYDIYWYDPLTGNEVSHEQMALSYGATLQVPDGSGDLLLIITKAAPVDGDEDEEVTADGDEEIEPDGDMDEETIEDAEPEPEIEEIEPEPEPEPEIEQEMEEELEQELEAESQETEQEEIEIAETTDSTDSGLDYEALSCSPEGYVRCSEDNSRVERCSSRGTWQIVELCEVGYKCDKEKQACVKIGTSKSSDDGCRSSNGAFGFVLLLILFGMKRTLPYRRGRA